MLITVFCNANLLSIESISGEQTVLWVDTVGAQTIGCCKNTANRRKLRIRYRKWFV